MVAVSELVDKLAVVAELDEAIGPIKRRARGLTGGEFVLSVVCAQLLGRDSLVGLDRVRSDVAGGLLASVPTPASTTGGSLARRFGPAQPAGNEAAAGALEHDHLISPEDRHLVAMACQ
ncbi:MAG: hypothetical protein WCG47_03090 [Dermatophilaceae bacterium]